MRAWHLLLPAACLFVAGCSTVYLEALEKVGIPKREVLVDRVDSARGAQSEAKEQFTSALQRFMAVTGSDGGELAQRYELLKTELDRSESRAKEVRDRLTAVEDVAAALFREWQAELDQYTNPTLRAQSERQLADTRRQYDTLIITMRRAADRMEPVLATFRDQVLFLKHNLNARAVAGLRTTAATLEADVSRLVADLERSIKEADAFLSQMREP